MKILTKKKVSKRKGTAAPEPRLRRLDRARVQVGDEVYEGVVVIAKSRAYAIDADTGEALGLTFTLADGWHVEIDHTNDWKRVKSFRKIRSAQSGHRSKNPLSARSQGQVRSASDSRRVSQKRGRGVSDAVVMAKVRSWNEDIRSSSVRKWTEDNAGRGVYPPYFGRVRDIYQMSEPESYKANYSHFAKNYPGWKYGDFKLMLDNLDHKAAGLRDYFIKNPKNKAAKKNPSAKKAASTRKRKGYTIRVDQSPEGLFAFAATHPEFQTFDSDYEFSTAAKAFGYVNRQIDKQEARKATSKMWGDIGMNPSKRKKNPSRQAGGFYIVDTRVGKVVAGPYSVREADMTLEESAGYDHATHQVMDERYLADQAFKAKKNPAKKKVAKKKVAKKTPEWQLLCNRCSKLWDYYCERPSKTRLKPVLEHLEKMKSSTSKKVADERKACLRVANKEARRLKMK